MSSAKIIQLFPASYEAALRAFTKHVSEECEECGQDRLCEQGQYRAMFAWSLLSPQPRRSEPDCQRRRSS